MIMVNDRSRRRMPRLRFGSGSFVSSELPLVPCKVGIKKVIVVR